MPAKLLTMTYFNTIQLVLMCALTKFHIVFNKLIENCEWKGIDMRNLE